MALNITEGEFILLATLAKTNGEAINLNLDRISKATTSNISDQKRAANYKALSQISDDLVRLADTSDIIATSLETPEGT